MSEYDMDEVEEPQSVVTSDEEYTVIIDIGEGYTKCGFAGEEGPRSVFPTMVGKPRYQAMAGTQAQEVYVGEDCARMRGVLKIKYPISRGNIMDWDSYFALLTHIFYTELRIDPAKCHVIYSIDPLTAPETKQYIARVFFESYRAKTVYVGSAAIFSLFSTGKTTGLLVESGEGLTWVVPIVKGRIIQHAVQKLPLAGLDVNENLKSNLLQNGISLSGTSAEREILREIKEKNCFIALDPDEIIAKRGNEESFYILPDGEKVNINMSIRVNSPEILFYPGILGYNIENIPQAIITAISKVDRAHWRDMLDNIVISGGNTLFQGIELRLEKEIKKLLPNLGPLPPRAESLQSEKKKLVSVSTSEKIKDTCPQCGSMVNLQESKFCPDCGAELVGMTIDIPVTAPSSFPDKCPSCNKKLKEKSAFCPHCGAPLTESAVSEIEEFNGMDASEFGEDGFGGDIGSEKDLNIEIPENRDIAIFKGAAILGSLPSFRKLFINYQQFLANPSSVDADFSSIL